MSRSIQLEQGVDIARAVEAIVCPMGYHVGISGGVLFRGSSKHDLDLFLYRHNEAEPSKKAELLSALAEKGFLNQFQTEEDYVEKDVVITNYAGVRVDFFFVSGKRGIA